MGIAPGLSPPPHIGGQGLAQGQSPGNGHGRRGGVKDQGHVLGRSLCIIKVIGGQGPMKGQSTTGAIGSLVKGHAQGQNPERGITEGHVQGQSPERGIIEGLAQGQSPERALIQDQNQEKNHSGTIIIKGSVLGQSPERGHKGSSTGLIQGLSPGKDIRG